MVNIKISIIFAAQKRRRFSLEKDILRGGAVVARWAHNPKVAGSSPVPATWKNPKLEEMNKVPLNVLGISYSQTQTNAYALVLGEENGNRRIPIIIGGFEAQAIAVHFEGLKTPRPLTHDLFYKFATEYGIFVESVFIFRLEEGIFYSKLVCSNAGKRVELDARTSDAIALALRFDCPIYTTADILDKAGIIFSNEPQSQVGQPPPIYKKGKKKTELQYMDIPELEKQLKKAITNENYEKASEIRDEIKRRKRE